MLCYRANHRRLNVCSRLAMLCYFCLVDAAFYCILSLPRAGRRPCVACWIFCRCQTSCNELIVKLSPTIFPTLTLLLTGRTNPKTSRKVRNLTSSFVVSCPAIDVLVPCTRDSVTETLRSLVHGTVCQQNCISQTSNCGNFDGYWKRFCVRETSALSDFCFRAPYKYSATATPCLQC